jgi:hypothetical protein
MHAEWLMASEAEEARGKQRPPKHGWAALVSVQAGISDKEPNFADEEEDTRGHGEPVGWGPLCVWERHTRRERAPVDWGARWQRWRVEVLIDVEKEERQHLFFLSILKSLMGR